MGLLPASPDATALRLVRLSLGIFFFGGFVTTLVSLLVPRLKLVLELDYTEALLVQFTFHSSYLLFALPIVLAIVRIGYARAIASGLLVMVVGCLGLAVAVGLRHLDYILLALLLLSMGLTFLQMACNTVVTVVGSRATAASRLTLLQGFNSLGTVLAPLLGAQFLLADAQSGAATPSIAGSPAVPFVFSAIMLLLLSLGFARNRNFLPEIGKTTTPPLHRLRALVATPRLQAGTAAIFAYVGAEVTIGSLLTNYLMLPGVLAAEPTAAARLVSFYWGGAMAGRFVGAYLLRRFAAAKILLLAALGAAALTAFATMPTGYASATALLAVGLCNSIMYPTIYALALPDNEADAPLASMLLCMAVVGGAVVPMLTGFAAEAFGLPLSFALSAICYLAIAAFARSCLRGPAEQAGQPG